MNKSPERQTRKSRYWTKECLENIGATYNVPWGLSDEKSHTEESIIVDTMSNLAENIHRFETKLRVIKRQLAHKHNKNKSTDRSYNVRADEQSSFRLLVDDYRKRLHQYVLGDRTIHNEVRFEPEVEKKENYFRLPLKERKSTELKNIEVKFGVC
jgi:hypothetical protein